MAGYVKELLCDLAANKIVHYKDIDYMLSRGMGISWEYLGDWESHCEFRCDIVAALQSLLDTEQVDRDDILILSRFMNGYSTIELSIEYANVQERLIKILALLEYASGYTDNRYISGVLTRYPHHTPAAAAYRDKLHMRGREFE